MTISHVSHRVFLTVSAPEDPEKACRHFVNPKRCGLTFVCTLKEQHLAAWQCRVRHESMLGLSVLQTQHNNRVGWMPMTRRPLQCCPIWFYNAETRVQRCHPQSKTHLWQPNLHYGAATHACSTCLGVKIAHHPLHQQASRSTHLQNR